MWHSLTWPKHWGDCVRHYAHRTYNMWMKKNKPAPNKITFSAWLLTVFLMNVRCLRLVSEVGIRMCDSGLVARANTRGPMNPRLLLLILTWLSQVPVPDPCDALDVASWQTNIPFFGVSEGCQGIVLDLVYTCAAGTPYQNDHIRSEVELCAGEANLSRAMAKCGHNVKCFDATWWWCSDNRFVSVWKNEPIQIIAVLPCEVRYSKNHDLLRTTGFIAVLAAVPWTLKIGLSCNLVCTMLN